MCIAHSNDATLASVARGYACVALSLKSRVPLFFWVRWGLFFAGGDVVDGGVAHLVVASSALAEPLLVVFALECAGEVHCSVLPQP